MPSPVQNISENFALLHNKSFILYCWAGVASTLAYQMLAVAVGWQVYTLTKSAFYLGLVGLVQFLPMILLTFIVGHAADRYNRRRIISICQSLGGAGVLTLAAGSYYGWLNIHSILVILFFLGSFRAFESPTMQALMPNLVPTELFPRAAAWATSSAQAAVIIGPALGGLLYIYGPAVVYSVIGLLFLTASLLLFLMKVQGTMIKSPELKRQSLFAGLAYIRSKPEILGPVSLDLFAVLLGGVTALLPIYAQEILHTGPLGLGILRAAPAIGAMLMSAYLARHPLRQRVGRMMFIAVFIFGIATLVFAVSTSFVLSSAALIILGGADVVSVVIRASLVQLGTPDEMRGRVSAVNMLFIGASNQLGEFESGLTAAWFGTVPAASSFVFYDADHAAELFDLKQYGHIYSRISNPTVSIFEERMASLEGATGAVATASGMAAQLAVFMTLLEPGDEVVSSSHLYGGTFVATYLRAAGYRIIPVNPRADRIFGEPCYPNLASIPEHIDLVDIFRPSADCLNIVEEAVACKAKAVWLQLKIINLEAAELAQKAGLLTVMDLCLKMEHGRYSGGLHEAGMNTEIISSQRTHRYI